MARGDIQIRDQQVRCPDCGAWVDFTMTLGPTERRGNDYVVPIGLDEELFMETMVSHIQLNPEIHPSFVG